MRKLLVVCEAYVRLIAHDAFMAGHDLAALHRRIKRCALRTRKPYSLDLEQLTHAFNVACAFYPKQALCLERSAVLVEMLRRRGIPARMVIGAQKLPFKAHAWVEVEGAVINDHLTSREKFLVLEVC